MKDKHYWVEITQVITQTQYVAAPTAAHAALLAGLRWEQNIKRHQDPTMTIKELNDEEWDDACA